MTHLPEESSPRKGTSQVPPPLERSDAVPAEKALLEAHSFDLVFTDSRLAALNWSLGQLFEAAFAGEDARDSFPSASSGSCVNGGDVQASAFSAGEASLLQLSRHLQRGCAVATALRWDLLERRRRSTRLLTLLVKAEAAVRRCLVRLEPLCREEERVSELFKALASLASGLAETRLTLEASTSFYAEGGRSASLLLERRRLFLQRTLRLLKKASTEGSSSWHSLPTGEEDGTALPLRLCILASRCEASAPEWEDAVSESDSEEEKPQEASLRLDPGDKTPFSRVAVFAHSLHLLHSHVDAAPCTAAFSKQKPNVLPLAVAAFGGTENCLSEADALGKALAAERLRAEKERREVNRQISCALRARRTFPGAANNATTDFTHLDAETLRALKPLQQTLEDVRRDKAQLGCIDSSRLRRILESLSCLQRFAELPLDVAAATAVLEEAAALCKINQDFGAADSSGLGLTKDAEEFREQLGGAAVLEAIEESVHSVAEWCLLLRATGASSQGPVCEASSANNFLPSASQQSLQKPAIDPPLRLWPVGARLEASAKEVRCSFNALKKPLPSANVSSKNKKNNNPTPRQDFQQARVLFCPSLGLTASLSASGRVLETKGACSRNSALPPRQLLAATPSPSGRLLFDLNDSEASAKEQRAAYAARRSVQTAAEAAAAGGELSATTEKRSGELESGVPGGSAKQPLRSSVSHSRGLRASLLALPASTATPTPLQVALAAAAAAAAAKTSGSSQNHSKPSNAKSATTASAAARRDVFTCGSVFTRLPPPWPGMALPLQRREESVCLKGATAAAAETRSRNSDCSQTSTDERGALPADPCMHGILATQSRASSACRGAALTRILLETLSSAQGHAHGESFPCESVEIEDLQHPLRLGTSPLRRAIALRLREDAAPVAADHQIPVVFGEVRGRVLLADEASASSRSVVLFQLPFYKGAFQNEAAISASLAASLEGCQVSLPREGSIALAAEVPSEKTCKNAKALAAVSHFEVPCVDSRAPIAFRQNCRLHAVFVNGWPHLVLTSIPGVEIRAGDFLFCDFGSAFFEQRLQLLRRETRIAAALGLCGECQVCARAFHLDCLYTAAEELRCQDCEGTAGRLQKALARGAGEEFNFCHEEEAAEFLESLADALRPQAPAPREALSKALLSATAEAASASSQKCNNGSSLSPLESSLSAVFSFPLAAVGALAKKASAKTAIAEAVASEFEISSKDALALLRVLQACEACRGRVDCRDRRRALETLQSAEENLTRQLEALGAFDNAERQRCFEARRSERRLRLAELVAQTERLPLEQTGFLWRQLSFASSSQASPALPRLLERRRQLRRMVEWLVLFRAALLDDPALRGVGGWESLLQKTLREEPQVPSSAERALVEHQRLVVETLKEAADALLDARRRHQFLASVNPPLSQTGLEASSCVNNNNPTINSSSDFHRKMLGRLDRELAATNQALALAAQDPRAAAVLSGGLPLSPASSSLDSSDARLAVSPPAVRGASALAVLSFVDLTERTLSPPNAAGDAAATAAAASSLARLARLEEGPLQGLVDEAAISSLEALARWHARRRAAICAVKCRMQRGHVGVDAPGFSNFSVEEEAAQQRGENSVSREKAERLWKGVARVLRSALARRSGAAKALESLNSQANLAVNGAASEAARQNSAENLWQRKGVPSTGGEKNDAFKSTSPGAQPRGRMAECGASHGERRVFNTKTNSCRTAPIQREPQVPALEEPIEFPQEKTPSEHFASSSPPGLPAPRTSPTNAFSEEPLSSQKEIAAPCEAPLALQHELAQTQEQEEQQRLSAVTAQNDASEACALGGSLESADLRGDDPPSSSRGEELSSAPSLSPAGLGVHSLQAGKEAEAQAAEKTSTHCVASSLRQGLRRGGRVLAMAKRKNKRAAARHLALRRLLNLHKNFARRAAQAAREAEAEEASFIAEAEASPANLEKKQAAEAAGVRSLKAKQSAALAEEKKDETLRSLKLAWENCKNAEAAVRALLQKDSPGNDPPPSSAICKSSISESTKTPSHSPPSAFARKLHKDLCEAKAAAEAEFGKAGENAKGTSEALQRAEAEVTRALAEALPEMQSAAKESSRSFSPPIPVPQCASSQRAAEAAPCGAWKKNIIYAYCCKDRAPGGVCLCGECKKRAEEKGGAERETANDPPEPAASEQHSAGQASSSSSEGSSLCTSLSSSSGGSSSSEWEGEDSPPRLSRKTASASVHVHRISRSSKEKATHRRRGFPKGSKDRQGGEGNAVRRFASQLQPNPCNNPLPPFHQQPQRRASLSETAESGEDAPTGSASGERPQLGKGSGGRAIGEGTAGLMRTEASPAFRLRDFSPGLDKLLSRQRRDFSRPVEVAAPELLESFKSQAQMALFSGEAAHSAEEERNGLCSALASRLAAPAPDVNGGVFSSAGETSVLLLRGGSQACSTPTKTLAGREAGERRGSLWTAASLVTEAVARAVDSAADFFSGASATPVQRKRAKDQARQAFAAAASQALKWNLRRRSFAVKVAAADDPSNTRLHWLAVKRRGPLEALVTAVEILLGDVLKRQVS